MLAKPGPIAIRARHARIDALDLRRRAERRHPSRDLLAAVCRRPAFRSGEDDQQAIERSEALKERPERRHRAPSPRQQARDVVVERHSTKTERRGGDEADGRAEDHPPPAVRPYDDGLNRRSHGVPVCPYSIVNIRGSTGPFTTTSSNVSVLVSPVGNCMRSVLSINEDRSIRSVSPVSP